MNEPVSRDDRLMAALAYPFWPLVFLVVYLAPEKRGNRFLRYHSYHGLFLGFALWGGGVLVKTAAALVGKYLAVFGVLLYPLVKLLGWLAMAVVAYSMYVAWNGQYLVLPYLTEFVLPFIDEPEVFAREDGGFSREPEEPPDRP